MIYSNTITNGMVIDALAAPARTVITHVHELSHWIDNRVDPVGLARTMHHTDRFIAASRAVEAHLLRMGVAPSMVDVVYETVDLRERPSDNARTAIRRLHGIPPGAFVVGGVGTTDWRKAPDVFVQVAAALMRLRPHADLHFLWLGGHDGGLADAELRHDAVLAGLEGRVHFVAAQPNPLDYLSGFDVLALTSREDPFPLVCLEAASVGTPIVCFAGAGGAPSSSRPMPVCIVPYLDVHAFARALARAIRNDEATSTGTNCSRQPPDRRQTAELRPVERAKMRRFRRGARHGVLPEPFQFKSCAT